MPAGRPEGPTARLLGPLHTHACRPLTCMHACRFEQVGGNTAQLAMSAPFSVQDRLKLEADEACYVLLMCVPCVLRAACAVHTVRVQVCTTAALRSLMMMMMMMKHAKGLHDNACPLQRCRSACKGGGWLCYTLPCMHLSPALLAIRATNRSWRSAAGFTPCMRGCLHACRESAVPIFTVALQCSIPLQLLDVPSNVAIISRSPPDEGNGNLTLATYRWASDPRAGACMHAVHACPPPHHTQTQTWIAFRSSLRFQGVWETGDTCLMCVSARHTPKPAHAVWIRPKRARPHVALSCLPSLPAGVNETKACCVCGRAWRRCQDSTSRLAVKFKVREGRAAALSAFVIPAITPKVCVSVKHGIRPLCLHTRVAEADTSRPMNDLTFTGAPALRCRPGRSHTASEQPPWPCGKPAPRPR